MSSQWFEIEVRDRCDLGLPGIYIWYIGSKPTYAGKSVRLADRIGEYRRNVQRIEDGYPYHIAGKTFRTIHQKLFDAKQSGHAVKVIVVENCSKELIHARERFWIALVARCSTCFEAVD